MKIYKNTPDDKSWLNFVFTMSKKESDDKSVNVKRGNRQKFFEKRVWLGVAKSGYLNSIDLNTKEKIIIEDKVRLPLIEKAFKLLLTGSYTPMEVLHKLNNDWGYRTRPFKRKDKSKQKGPQPLSRSGFYKILNDPFYWGLMIRREGEVMGTHKTIMTKDEFERIQVMLGGKGRHTSQKYEFPYKGVLKCGECGASITAEHKWQIICPNCKTKFNRGKSTVQCPSCQRYIDQMKGYKLLHYIYYHCTKKAHPDCSQGCITLEKIEEQIKTELKRFEISESFKDWAIKYLNEFNDSEVVDRESIRESQQKLYNDCVQRIDNLVKLRISSENSSGEQISEEEYITQRRALMAEKEGWLAKINDTNERMNNWLELSERTFNFACYARYWFEKGDLKTKTHILAAIGSNLTIKDKKLWVDGQKPFFLIEKCLQSIKAEAPEFEPAKELDFTQQTPLLDIVRSYMLGD